MTNFSFLRSSFFTTFIFFHLFPFSLLLSGTSEEKKMVIVIPSYNNEQWVEINLESLFSQEYKNYRVIYINDCSTDRTAEIVKECVEQHNQEKRFTLINNKENVGALENLYHAIHSCDDDDIIVTYDGDDWFPHNQVLKVVNETYAKKEVWLTYGSFTLHPDGGKFGWPYPKKIISKNKFRKFTTLPSHLRTFYCWLFKRIKPEDLKYQGEFYPAAWDLAMMFPMIEMAGSRHAFIDQILYVYNFQNPISDFRIRQKEQSQFDIHIRKQLPYRKLKNKYDKHYLNP